MTNYQVSQQSPEPDETSNEGTQTVTLSGGQPNLHQSWNKVSKGP